MVAYKTVGSPQQAKTRGDAIRAGWARRKRREAIVPGKLSATLRGAIHNPGVSIIEAVRANGVAQYAEGLSDLFLTVRPNGEITLTPVGKVPSPNAAARLHAWAVKYTSVKR